MPIPSQQLAVCKNLISHGLSAFFVATLVACGGGNTETSSIDGFTAATASTQPNSAATSNQIIVQLRQDPVVTQFRAISAAYVAELSATAGVTLTPVSTGFQNAIVMELGVNLGEAGLRKVTQRLRERDDVAFAEPNLMAKKFLIPNDTRFLQQWSLRESTVAAGGANLPDAWDLTTGDPSLVIAVLDTGVLRHADISARLLTGYDFISSATNGNDGDGRDTDASDAGDWITTSEAATYGENHASPSSWHGTHVAGTIAATGNNSYGVTGINWKSKILPVRVLGKGGGSTSDIADGLAWAAGAHINGVPDNANPARVINISLGGVGQCPAMLQQAINYAVSRNAVVVVAAGNEATSADQTYPANCIGVITVAAVGQSGAAARYTNFGKFVAIAAPGGDKPRDTGILSLGDGGTTRPINDNSTLIEQGTSMAAPHVAGVVSLMLSVNPNLTPAQVKSLLQSTARRFPTGVGRDCNTTACGAGILNAAGAVRAAASGEAAIRLGQPQSGWWWNPAEGGRGFALEIRDGRLFFAGFLYEASGRATWYASGPTAMQSPTKYIGTLDKYFGGQTMNGAYKTPVNQGSAGQLTIDFTDATHAVMSWPGGSVNIERFEFVNQGLATAVSSFAPESGWWWNPDEGGRGFAIEVQKGSLFMSSFFYDDIGNPIWNISTGAMSAPNLFEGDWLLYANGQTLAGSYKSPKITNAKAGAVKLKFSDTTHATLTLPNGREIPLERFTVGYQSPLLNIPIGRVMSAKLVGIWNFAFTIISRFDEYYKLDTMRESSTNSGEFYVWGIDIYDQLVLAYYDQKYDSFVAYKTGSLIDYFYIFYPKTLPSTDFVGCYYLVSKPSGALSRCYPLNVIKLLDVTPKSFQKLGEGSMELNQAIDAKIIMDANTLSEKKMEGGGASRASMVQLNDTRAQIMLRNIAQMRQGAQQLSDRN